MLERIKQGTYEYKEPICEACEWYISYPTAELTFDFDFPEGYEISPIIGVFIFEDNSYDSSLAIGVSSLFNITKRYALEGEIGFSPSSFNYVYGNKNIKEPISKPK